MRFTRPPTTAAGVTFTQLRLADALSASPEDPNNVFNSVTEDADGWAVEIQGPAVDGLAEGTWFIFDMPDGWRGDGSQALKFRFSEVTNNGGWWWSVAGILDDSALTASAPVGVGVGFRLDTGGTRRALAMTAAGNFAVVVGTAAMVGNGTVIPAGPDDATGSAGAAIVVANGGAAVWATTATAQALAANSGAKKMVLGFGTIVDSSGGAITGKAKFEVAVIELDAAGVFP